MHIWTITKWKKIVDCSVPHRSGIRFRYDKNVDPEVKRAVSDFAVWLRTEYYFPFRINVYVKASKIVRTMDGDKVVGSFFEPLSYSDESYIRIATGDYNDLVNSGGKDDALASILNTLSHELTHYFQWINGVQLTDTGRERQAAKYAEYIIDEYATTRDHP